MVVAHERHCWEPTLFGLSDSWWGSPARIFTHGDLHHLIPNRTGLLHSSNCMGIEGGDKAGKKEITLQVMDSVKGKSLEAKRASSW